MYVEPFYKVHFANLEVCSSNRHGQCVSTQHFTVAGCDRVHLCETCVYRDKCLFGYLFRKDYLKK